MIHQVVNTGESPDGRTWYFRVVCDPMDGVREVLTASGLPCHMMPLAPFVGTLNEWFQQAAEELICVCLKADQLQPNLWTVSATFGPRIPKPQIAGNTSVGCVLQVGRAA